MSQAKDRYTLLGLGKHINRLIHALVLTKDWSEGDVVAEIARRTNYSEAMVYRWRQGRNRPNDDTLKTLAQLGKMEAKLDRFWGEGLLDSARYTKPAISILVNEIWGPVEIRVVLNNLPKTEHTKFFGRQEEMKRLLELLSPERGATIISVDGIGGVGKTALVLETAYRCLRASTGESFDPHAPRFDAIIFASAKHQRLTSYGIFPVLHAQRTLREIFLEITQTLDRRGITLATQDEQFGRVREALSRQRTLLILDNLETIEDKQDVLAFLFDLPPSVKVIITTRERQLFAPIRLGQLPEMEGLQFVRREAEDKRLDIDDRQAQKIYQRTGGVPVAMIYAIGQMVAGNSIENVLNKLLDPKEDVARFCFHESIAPLRGQPEHKLLMALAIFPEHPLREAGICVAGFSADPITADEGLAHLQRLSLVGQDGNRISMLPLTREYALAELAADPTFEKEAREMWVDWYLNFARKYGDVDWHEWHIQYDRLEEEWSNLLAVFYWCAAQDRYTAIKAFWLEKRVGGFASVYGYWNDRLIWLDWLIKEGERRGDWPTAVEAMSSKGWSLMFLGKNEEANDLFEQAWDFRNEVNFEIQGELSHNRAILCIRQRNYADAFYWLSQNESALTKAELGEKEYLRSWIALIYYRAEIFYNTGDYGQAKKLYEEMIEKSQYIRWQRAVIYAQNWLADVAREQGDLDGSQRLLLTGLPVAERNKDKRRTAFYNRSFALLEQKRGDLGEARLRAEAALDGFDRLGMQPEVDEMRELLEMLASEV